MGNCLWIISSKVIKADALNQQLYFQCRIIMCDGQLPEPADADFIEMQVFGNRLTGGDRQGDNRVFHGNKTILPKG